MRTPTLALALTICLSIQLLNASPIAATTSTTNPATQATVPQATNIVRPNPSPYPSMYDNNIVVAFYGHPFGSKMGVLGENPIDVMTNLLRRQAAEYDAVNGDDGVIPAYHLIYAVAHPDATTTRLRDDVVLQYIQYAMKNNIIVVLDHQLGNASVAEGVRSMLPWLAFPNVHIAIDPEWRTANPGREIGSITAAELNNALDMVQQYLVDNNIQQRKMFMVHQFFYRMITNREQVTNNRDRIDLIHNADGFGHPGLKMETYRFIAQAKNMPLKGFKLFYPKPWKNAGYDSPLMTPRDVMSINPRPIFINYQ